MSELDNYLGDMERGEVVDAQWGRELDEADLKLLRLFSDNVFEFTKNAAQEKRAFYLFKAGLLERRDEVVSRTARTEKHRWSYRRTAEGKRAAEEHA